MTELEAKLASVRAELNKEVDSKARLILKYDADREALTEAAVSHAKELGR